MIHLPLLDRGRLDLDEHLRQRQAGDAEQRLGRADIRGLKPSGQRTPMLLEQIDIRGENAEPDNVGERHFGIRKDGFQIVDHEGQLPSHVSNVLNLAVRCAGNLAGDVEHSLVPLDELAQAEADWTRPVIRIDAAALHHVVSGLCIVGSTGAKHRMHPAYAQSRLGICIG